MERECFQDIHVSWFIIHIESHGRLSTSQDAVRQMRSMNMRVVVMVWLGAEWRWQGRMVIFPLHDISPGATQDTVLTLTGTLLLLLPS